MHEFFADWHREFSIDFATVDLTARSETADRLAEEATPTDCAGYIAVAFGQSAPESFLAKVRDSFKETEPAFPMRNNDAELAMLAAAILESVCAREDGVALLAAYLTSVADDNGWDAAVPELLQTAGRTLVVRAASHRVRESAPSVRRMGPWKESTSEQVLAHLVSEPYPSLAEQKAAFSDLVGAAGDQLLAMTSEIRAYEKWTASRVALMEEESELLWWMLSDYSTHLGRPRVAVQGSDLAVVLGREIVELARVMPLPPQSSSIVRQILTVHEYEGGAAEPYVLSSQEVPDALEFLLSAEPAGGDSLKIALSSMNRAAVLRIWSEQA